MLLAVDIGNTNIVLGVFENNSLIKTFRLKTDINASYIEQLEFLKFYNIQECAIVSVVTELNDILKSACDNVFGINSKLVSYKNLDIKIALDEPEKVGIDRLINAYAALKKYSLPLIVIDVGTAITFDIVAKDKSFIGGIIMPGINLQYKSLNEYTSKLPLVSNSISSCAIGNNTETAISSGVLRGVASAIEGLIYQCEVELGEKAMVIATGGQAEIVANYMMRKFDYINPTLTLEGLMSACFDSHVNLY